MQISTGTVIGGKVVVEGVPLVEGAVAEDEMRAEYRREDLGKGARGKYFDRVSKGSNRVLLNDTVAKAFPNAEAVNEALLGLLAPTEQTARLTGRPKRVPRKRVAA